MCVVTAASPSDNAVIIQFSSAVPHQCGGAAMHNFFVNIRPRHTLSDTDTAALMLKTPKSKWIYVHF